MHDRTIPAVVVAGPAGTISCVLVLMLWSFVIDGPEAFYYVGPLPLLLLGLAVGMFLGLPAIALGLMPLHAALFRAQLRAFWAYALAGAIIGALATVLVWMTAGPFGRFSGWLLIGTMCGAFSALVFWLIRRPDRDAALTSPPSPQTSPR